MLRCPSFRADVITAVNARSLDVFVLSVLKHGTDWSPCRLMDMLLSLRWVFVLWMSIILGFGLVALFYHLTEQTASDVRKDGSGVDGEVKNMNELQGKDEVLHDKPDYDRAVI